MNRNGFKIAKARRQNAYSLSKPKIARLETAAKLELPVSPLANQPSIMCE